ncbi:MAG: pyridoxamine 5'-phosphate oxidase [Actinomycetota bacterium]|nr:pyridoxamine 5'-phosphate oxidase [Actinomycetota bacterium]
MATQGRIAVSDLRRSYRRSGLSEAELAADPLEQFDRWLQEAIDAGMDEPTAMVLATADADGRPSARTVLLKGYDERGFVFFTGHDSRKGRELGANPRASLLFPWIPLERQVIVLGDVERATREEAVAYFRSRPRGSQLGAVVSDQNSVISSRAVLEDRLAELVAAYPEGTEVPVPERWGGYRVVPSSIEFWQGREDRLHDRLRFRRDGGGWVAERLMP